MRLNKVILFATIAIGAATATPVSAAITVCGQGTSCVTDTTTVNLDSYTNAPIVTGNVGVSGPLVTFTSTDGNLSTNTGAATIFTANNSLLDNLTFTILSGFTAAEFNLENGSPSSFMVSLTDTGGDVFNQTLTALNGSNIFNIVAPAGTTYTSATFSSTNGGFNDFKQLRVTLGATAVPEAATWAMMLLGFAGIGTVMRRTRRVPLLMQIA